MTKENKEKYIGMFKNGLKCGKGTQIDANGDKFEGYFESKLINITTVNVCDSEIISSLRWRKSKEIIYTSSLF